MADDNEYIVAERLGLPPPSLAFLVAVLALAGAAAVALVILGSGLESATSGEGAFARTRGPLALLETAMGPAGGRILSAALAGIGVAATALAGRRLLHSEASGITAAVILALEPALLAQGHMALPAAPLMGLAATAWAGFLSPRPALRWLASGCLALAACIDPMVLLWGIPLGAAALLRGNIYAAPKHLAITLLQALVLPGLAAALVLVPAALVSQGKGVLSPACLDPGYVGELTLSRLVALGGGRYAAHNPATWIAGWGALLVMGAGALVALGRDFRIARLPGRLQVRLQRPLARAHARALWLLLFALAVPNPLLWTPILAVAVAAGIQALAEDAPGFGWAVRLGAAAFAVLYLVRLWPLIAGLPPADADLLPQLPWQRIVGC